MESIVKHRDLRDEISEGLLRCLKSAQGRPVMNGSNGDHFRNGILDVLGDECGFHILFAALNRTVTDSGDLIQRLDAPGLPFDQHLLNDGKSSTIICHRHIDIPDPAFLVVFDMTHLFADALAGAANDGPFFIHFNQLKLQRRTAGIDHQDLGGKTAHI